MLVAKGHGSIQQVITNVQKVNLSEPRILIEETITQGVLELLPFE